jgi:hypothetical protein
VAADARGQLKLMGSPIKLETKYYLVLKNWRNIKERRSEGASVPLLPNWATD